ncbi:hypothetical protein BSKO_01498 [Bryopsis sp. KO-2023]|nr:hypothetical protein BSKO_01498 [Bryopsis sp. KO-2023]
MSHTTTAIVTPQIKPWRFVCESTESWLSLWEDMHVNDAFRRFRKRYQADNRGGESSTPSKDEATPKRTIPARAESPIARRGSISGRDDDSHDGGDPLLRSFVADELGIADNRKKKETSKKSMPPMVKICKKKKKRGKQIHQAPMAVVDPLCVNTGGKNVLRSRALSTALHMLKGKASKPILPRVCLGNEVLLKSGSLRGTNSEGKTNCANRDRGIFSEQVGRSETKGRPRNKYSLPKNHQIELHETKFESDTEGEGESIWSKMGGHRSKKLNTQNCYKKKSGKRECSMSDRPSPPRRAKKPKGGANESCYVVSKESEGGVKTIDCQPEDFRKHFVLLKEKFRSVVSKEIGVKIDDLGKGAKKSLLTALLSKLDGVGNSVVAVQIKEGSPNDTGKSNKVGSPQSEEPSMQASVSSVNISSTKRACPSKGSMLGVSRRLVFEGGKVQVEEGLLANSLGFETNSGVDCEGMGHRAETRAPTASFCKPSGSHISRELGCYFSQENGFVDDALGVYDEGPLLSDGEFDREKSTRHTPDFHESSVYVADEGLGDEEGYSFLDSLSPETPRGGDLDDCSLILECDTGSPEPISDLMGLTPNRASDWLEDDGSPLIPSPGAEFHTHDLDGINQENQYDAHACRWDSSGNSFCSSDWASVSEDFSQPEMMASLSTPSDEDPGDFPGVLDELSDLSHDGGSGGLGIGRYACEDEIPSSLSFENPPMQSMSHSLENKPMESLLLESHKQRMNSELGKSWSRFSSLGISGSRRDTDDVMDMDGEGFRSPVNDYEIDIAQQHNRIRESNGRKESDFELLDDILSGSMQL